MLSDYRSLQSLKHEKINNKKSIATSYMSFKSMFPPKLIL